jgi:hypothetical protein
VRVSGWALAENGATPPGIETIHVWAFPVSGGAAQFVGVPTLGISRPDVGAIYGPGYENAGFDLTPATLASGTWDIAVFAKMTGVASFSPPRVIRITIP